MQSSVFVLSLSSEMNIMLLLFFFFLLFLSLTSASPTVTTPSTVQALKLPLERGRVEDQEVGDSGGRSLGGGRRRVRSKLKWLNVDFSYIEVDAILFQFSVYIYPVDEMC